MGYIRSRSRLVWLSCSLLASLLAMVCSGCDPTSSAPPPDADGALGLRSDALTQPLACGGNRWIAIKEDATRSCDTYGLPSGWKTEQLFSDFGAFSPHDLRQYCRFEWTLSAPAPIADIDTFQMNSGLDNVVEDCPLIFPQSSDALLGSMAREQRVWIHAAAGGLSSLPKPSTPLRPTRLAIIDNAPDSIGPSSGPATLNPLLPLFPRTTAPPFGEHGKVLAYLGRDLGCPEGEGHVESRLFTCAVHAETVLAMRDGNLTGSPDDGSYAGGLFGRRSDLARAIKLAVDDWKDDVLSGEGAEPRLVINLSLGWEDNSPPSPVTGCKSCRVANPRELDSPSRAVYDAIVYARCHGALVVAAAGNDSGGPEPLRRTGLLYPAQLMQWDAPDDAGCARDSGDDDFEEHYREATQGLPLRPSVNQAAYDPLVYPIGGVDFGDEPLQPHRPESLPQLVAPGLLGSSYENDLRAVQTTAILPLNAPSPLSGTSVSTAIASAIAATAWAYSPDLAPADIMDLLHRTGVDPRNFTSVEVTRPEELEPGNDVVRRASLCRTLLGMNVAPEEKCEDSGPGEQHAQNPPMSPETISLHKEYYTHAESVQVEVAEVEFSTTPLGSLFTQSAALDVSPAPLYPTCTACGFKPANNGSTVMLYLDPALMYSSLYLVIDGVAYGSASRAPLLQTVNSRTMVELSGFLSSVTATSHAFLVWEDAARNSAHMQLPLLY